MQIYMANFAHGPAVSEGEEVMEYRLAYGIHSRQYTMEKVTGL